MKINKLIVLISTAMLIACSGQSDEAKKLGFSSVDEMKEIQAKGWHTKAKYDEDHSLSAVSPKEITKNDGFKNDAEREFMLAHGFDNKDAFNEYINAPVEKRIKISARNAAAKFTTERATDCIATASLTSNYLNNLPETTEQDKTANQIYINLWDLVLQEKLKEKYSEKSTLDNFKEFLQNKSNEFQNGDNDYKMSQIDFATECRKQVIPYFAEKDMTDYKEGKITSGSQTIQTQQSSKLETRDSQETRQSKSTEKLNNLANYWGPSGWARCTVGQVSISALIARGDPISDEIKNANSSLGDLIGLVRQILLNRNITQNSLDDLVRGFSTQVRTGDAAMQIVNQCLLDAQKISNQQ